MTSSLPNRAKTYLPDPVHLPQAGWQTRIRNPAENDRAVAVTRLLAEGVDAVREGDVESALQAFQRAHILDPEDPAPLLNGAVALRRAGRPAESRGLLVRALELASDWPEIHHNLGCLELDEDRPGAALPSVRRAVELAPDWPEARQTLGLTYRRLERYDKALEAFEQALVLHPGWQTARHHLAVTHQLSGDEDRALEAYESLVAEGCDLWETHNNLAFLLLKRGQYPRGFLELNWRFQNGGEPAPRLHRSQPIWRGEDLRGRTVLLCEEQGAGDMMQFIRLAESIRRRGGRAWVECGDHLRRLFESCPFLDGRVAPDEPCPDADFQLPMLSLPGVLGTHLEDVQAAARPYLRPDPEADMELKSTLDPWLAPFADRYKIGIVWTGSPLNGVNEARSCRPEDFVTLAADERVALFSLQFAPRETTGLEGLPIHNLIDFLGDFAHTAAVMQRMDLILTVDTSMAHLAGAVGAEAWVLLHRPGADWRWLEDRTDSPWYPSLRLFHQPQPGDWGGVMTEVRDALGPRLGGAGR